MDLLRRMDDYERGVYGLHNAVKEIKDVKAQLTIRDTDVAGRVRHGITWYGMVLILGHNFHL